MTQEEKDLLIVDLCGRLHYDVICKMSRDKEFPQENSIIEVLSISGYEAFVNTMNCSATTPFFVKPYLRPMSSMTEEEKKELQQKYIVHFSSENIKLRYHSEGYWDNDLETSFNDYLWLEDWLNSHHFDYRCLIPRGLALIALNDMYK